MPGAKNAPAPEGGFALTFGSAEGACSRCAGLPTLHVIDDSGAVIGHVVADWPWDTDIPDAPEQHPQTPHFVVEYFGQDHDGQEIPGIRADDPYFIALAIHERAKR